MRRQAMLPAAVLAVVLSGCVRKGTRARGIGGRVPPSLPPTLGALRDGIVPEDTDTVALQGWLKKALIKGVTSQKQVIATFGWHYKDLDRPKRDGIVTIEYFLGPPGNAGVWHYLVLDFDADTRLLSDWRISEAICGYCPHVFAHDGAWRLEGKLLAGCVGAANEGVDTLLLPRLGHGEGTLRVKVANLAPEIEHIDQVLLGSVELADGEELDVGTGGRPIAWRPVARWPAEGSELGAEELPDRRSGFVVPLEAGGPPRVLAIELRNTSAFEAAMRSRLRDGTARGFAPAVVASFDSGPVVELAPVGTKFLRRLVVPVPQGARSVRLVWDADHWLVRRLWKGAARVPQACVTWRSPIGARGTLLQAASSLRHVDGDRVRLGPMQEVELLFGPAVRENRSTCVGYVLRVSGYYEFINAPAKP